MLAVSANYLKPLCGEAFMAHIKGKKSKGLMTPNDF